MSSAGAFLRLTRIEHSVMLIVAVAAAELISGGIPSLSALVLSLLSPALISMGAFAINDYFDIAADRANKRTDRPLVSGAISKETAYAAAVLLLLIGTVVSFFVNLYAFVIAADFALLAYLYSYRLKDTVLLGNAYIALSMAIPFIYGNFVVATQVNANIILICLVVFLSGLAREIHGMIRDRVGDQAARKSRNLVRYIGARRSSEIALILYMEAIAIGLFMFVFMAPFRYNLTYLVLIVAADLISFYVSVGHLLGERPAFFTLARNLSLVAMSIGLLAYILSPIFFIAI